MGPTFPKWLENDKDYSFDPSNILDTTYLKSRFPFEKGNISDSNKIITLDNMLIQRNPINSNYIMKLWYYPSLYGHGHPHWIECIVCRSSELVFYICANCIPITHLKNDDIYFTNTYDSPGESSVYTLHFKIPNHLHSQLPNSFKVKEITFDAYLNVISFDISFLERKSRFLIHCI